METVSKIAGQFEYDIYYEIRHSREYPEYRIDESHWCALHDRLEEELPDTPDNRRLRELVLWMRRQPAWPHYELSGPRLRYSGKRRMAYTWWDGSDLGLPVAWQLRSLQFALLRGSDKCTITPSRIDHATLLEALENYYQAVQVERTLRGGPRVAAVPPQVGVCGECGARLFIVADRWDRRGFPALWYFLRSWGVPFLPGDCKMPEGASPCGHTPGRGTSVVYDIYDWLAEARGKHARAACSG